MENNWYMINRKKISNENFTWNSYSHTSQIKEEGFEDYGESSRTQNGDERKIFLIDGYLCKFMR